MVLATMALIGAMAIVLLFAVLKNLTDDYSTKWSYIGIVLAAVVAAGAWLQVQASGGVETLRSEVSSLTATDSRASTPTAEAPPAAEPSAAADETPPASSEPVS